MSINWALVEETLDWLEAHPDEWDQRYWMSDSDKGCGTTYCFAGAACKLSGVEVTSRYYPLMGFTEYYPVKENGLIGHFGDVAKELLGLTHKQANLIFHNYHMVVPDWRDNFQKFREYVYRILKEE